MWKKATKGVFSLTVAGVCSPAWATTYHVGLCFTVSPTYTEMSAAVGDDYFTSAAAVPAWGYWIRVFPHGSSTALDQEYLDDDNGAHPGCTAGKSIPVTAGSLYDIWLVSKAIVHGNTITYRRLTDGVKFADAHNSVGFATDNIYYTVSTAPNDAWTRAMGVMTFALTRKDAGLTLEAMDVWEIDDVNDGANRCGDTSCNSGDEIFLQNDASDHTLFKSVIAHEFGLQLLKRVTVNPIPPPDYSAAAVNGCSAGGSGHTLVSVEYHTAAVKEGFAKYYTDAVFNNTAGATCGAYTHIGTDFTVSGPPGNQDLYQCDAAPISGYGLPDGNWIGDQCNGASSLAGLATVYDYERFFWDMDNKEGLSVADIIGVMSDANASSPWDDSNSSSNVYDRIIASAGANGFDDSPDYPWFVQAFDNGVAH